MGFLTSIVLLLLQESLSAVASPALLTKKSIPEPYGHTANISPHAPNTDREWYTEYRWKNGQEYKPQDGVITEKPKFAPVPKPTPAPKKKFLRKPLNKKPVHDDKPKPKPKKTNAKVEEKHAKLPKEKPEKEPEPEPAAVKEEPEKKPKPAAKKKLAKEAVAKEKKNSTKAVTPPGVGGPVKKPPEPKYAVPKPCGHTSQVHPYNWNNDREWYTEYRWKKGSEYKIQDGPITEKPVGAKKIIQTFPVEQDCDPAM